jgi:nicotinamidase-related amidase
MPLDARPTPGAGLLNPGDHVLLLIDYQSQMAFATKSIDAITLRNNAGLIAETASAFGVECILTTVAAKSFSGPIFDEVKAPFPGHPVIDRTSMNTWEDAKIIDRVNAIGKRRLVLAGLWTSVCIVGPTLSAIDQGFEVYVIADACGDVSPEAHDRAMGRMVQAGARPMTSLQYLLELQRDWARSATYDLTTSIDRDRGGTYGLGIIYARAMIPGHPEAGATARHA